MSILNQITDYSNQVVNGEVLACTKHIWACQRFLNDLDRWQNSDSEFEYCFDEESAQRFVSWCGLFKHRKGPIAGQKFELAPIQLFVYGNIYGWVHKITGDRRFSKMYWQIARKNGKSMGNAISGTYELLASPFGEVPEVYSAATKKDQALIVFEDMYGFLNGSDVLKEGVHYEKKYNRIVSKKDGGFARCLSKEDSKKGDGLNPQYASVDEYHAHPTDEILKVLESGMVLRSNSLLSIITTAGVDLNNPCYTVEYKLASKILDPNENINIESYFVMINELETNQTDDVIEIDGRKVKPGGLIDDINDEKCWVKANPIVCSTETGIRKIRDRLAEALIAEENMKEFLTKNMNVWVNQRDFGYMNMAKWSACGVDQKEFFKLLNKNTTGTCYLGLDLSARIDLTSATFEFVGNDDKYYVFSHSFIPSDAFYEKIKTDKVPYDIWERNGWITVTDGGSVDYRHVKKWVMDKVKEMGWKIEEVCIDPWGGTQLSNDFDDEGITVVDVRQGYGSLAPPTKDVRDMVYNGRVVHDDNPVLSWAMGNAITRCDYNENIMLNKEKSRFRIDPAAALMNAHYRAMVLGTSTGVYEKRGMRIL